MTFLLDTSILIGWFRGYTREKEFIAVYQDTGLAISLATYGEFYEGVLYGGKREEREQRFRELLEYLTILPLDIAIMQRYAQIRGEMRRHGSNIGEFDMLIAATALVFDRIVVTTNKRHFSMVPGIQIHEFSTDA